MKNKWYQSKIGYVGAVLSLFVGAMIPNNACNYSSFKECSPTGMLFQFTIGRYDYGAIGLIIFPLIGYTGGYLIERYLIE